MEAVSRSAFNENDELTEWDTVDCVVVRGLWGLCDLAKREPAGLSGRPASDPLKRELANVVRRRFSDPLEQGLCDIAKRRQDASRWNHVARWLSHVARRRG